MHTDIQIYIYIARLIRSKCKLLIRPVYPNIQIYIHTQAYLHTFAYMYLFVYNWE